MKFIVDEKGLLKKVKEVKRKDTIIEIPSNVRELGNSVFFALRKVKQFVIPSSVEVIGQYAFQECVGLEEVVLPESITKLENAAFYSCDNLKKIIIPLSVKLIGAGCFENCKSLESVEILGQITKLNAYTFYNCKKLKSITLPSSLKTIIPFAFVNCNNLERIVLKNKDILLSSELRINFEILDNYYISKDNNTVIACKEKKLDPNFVEVNYKEYKDLLHCYNPVAVYASLFFNIQEIEKNNFLRLLLPKFINYPNEGFDCQSIKEKLCNFKEFENFTRKLIKKNYNLDKDKSIIYYDIFRLANCLGVFSDNYVERQRACEFLSNSIDKGYIDYYKIHGSFESLKFRDFDKELATFFMDKSNFFKLLDLEKNESGFISRVINDFDKIREYSRSNRGSQRYRKVTTEMCAEYLGAVHFDNVDEETLDVSQTISQYTRNQDAFDKACAIRKKYVDMKSKKNIDDHILGEELKEIRKEIVVEIKDSLLNLSETSENKFTYEFLSKHDPNNFVLGKYCSCCAHIEGIGIGIMKASILHPNCQNLVIKDKEGKIIAKSTLYINREQGYGVFNNIEISDNIVDKASKNLIYKKYMVAIEEFSKKYNAIYGANPLKQINIGMGLNDLETIFRKNHMKSGKILEGIDFSKYGGHMGDWQFEQYVLWENELFNKGEKINGR